MKPVSYYYLLLDRHRGKGKYETEELFEDLSVILQMLTSLITGEFEGLGMFLTVK